MHSFRQFLEAFISGRVGDDGMPILINKMGVPCIPSCCLRIEMISLSILFRAKSYFYKIWSFAKYVAKDLKDLKDKTFEI